MLKDADMRLSRILLHVVYVALLTLEHLTHMEYHYIIPQVMVFAFLSSHFADDRINLLMEYGSYICTKLGNSCTGLVYRSR